MRNRFVVAILGLALALGVMPVRAHAQTHKNTLSWTDSANPTGTTYNIYGDVVCPTATATPIGTSTSVAAGYTDATVTAGKTKTYQVTAVLNSVESTKSNCISALTPVFAPTGLQVTGINGQQVSLSWTASTDGPVTAQTLFHATSGCGTTPAWDLGTALSATATTFTTSATPGIAVQCYALGATVNGTSSAKSVLVQVTITAPVSNVTVVSQ